MAKKRLNGINETAEKYQETAQKIKALEAELAPLKKDLIAYGEDHARDFDLNFRLTFPCGVYLSQRVKDVLEVPKEKGAEFCDNLPQNFVKTAPDEAKIIAEIPTNNDLKKLLKSFGAMIKNKVTIAVYAK